MARRFEIDGSLSRWMCFVDGENLTMQAQAFAKAEGLALNEGPHFQRKTFVWVPEARPIDVILHDRHYGSYSRPVRSYYYTSVVGDVAPVRERLWQIGFHPEDALLLAAQTARGAASLALRDNQHPESEIDRVTTPRGCTIAGLNEMEHQGFSSAMIKGFVLSARKAGVLFDDGTAA